MDLKKRLELGQNKLQTSEVVDYVNGSDDRFKELVEVYIKGPYRITQQAAKPLTICVEKWPYLIEPHLTTLIRILHKTSAHDAVIRNTMRLFQYIKLPQRHQGKVADLCFAYLRDLKSPIAIRVFSMSVLSQIAKDHPEIKKSCC